MSIVKFHYLEKIFSTERFHSSHGLEISAYSIEYKRFIKITHLVRRPKSGLFLLPGGKKRLSNRTGEVCQLSILASVASESAISPRCELTCLFFNRIKPRPCRNYKDIFFTPAILPVDLFHHDLDFYLLFTFYAGNVSVFVARALEASRTHPQSGSNEPGNVVHRNGQDTQIEKRKLGTS